MLLLDVEGSTHGLQRAQGFLDAIQWFGFVAGSQPSQADKKVEVAAFYHGSIPTGAWTMGRFVMPSVGTSHVRLRVSGLHCVLSQMSSSCSLHSSRDET